MSLEFEVGNLVKLNLDDVKYGIVVQKSTSSEEKMKIAPIRQMKNSEDQNNLSKDEKYITQFLMPQLIEKRDQLEKKNAETVENFDVIKQTEEVDSTLKKVSQVSKIIEDLKAIIDDIDPGATVVLNKTMEIDKSNVINPTTKSDSLYRIRLPQEI